MRKYFLLGLILSLSAHAEKKTEPTIFHQSHPATIKEINYVDNEPRYGAYISSSNCSFEILINDIPVIKYNDDSGSSLSGSYFPLNEWITKKGNQKITIKMTPGFNQDTNALNSELSANSEMQIKIIKSLKNEAGNPEENEVRKYSTSKKKRVSSNVFEDAFTFFAEVPYYIKTLENAEVLLTDDKEKLQALEQEVFAKYDKIRNIYMKGSWSTLAAIYYNREKRVAQQLYLLPDEIKSRWNNDYVFRTNTGITFFDLKPVEDYKMTFYADGKIVCLQKINNEKSALWGGFKRKGKDNITTTYITLYLYRPKGTKELEVY
ncbi:MULTISPECIES: hypothetical protein [unclassified Chryseobacterium]|uniref:hypothetical protein n=1 Tax=unclassified Chryseobacterium TaxID=2593645 RepID=UPI00100B63C9|nr:MULTISPECIES: hypothetical protein [unclassified Chryseobacterium]RXM53051.1 hypothetical protein BOQ64_01210 [Chryseobacterium sp. CH25]RXM65752.1 hypothetical protein BOQ60_08295 [Chryseobacterium sp. CH1]